MDLLVVEEGGTRKSISMGAKAAIRNVRSRTCAAIHELALNFYEEVTLPFIPLTVT